MKNLRRSPREASRVAAQLVERPPLAGRAVAAPRAEEDDDACDYWLYDDIFEIKLMRHIFITGSFHVCHTATKGLTNKMAH